MTDETPTRGPGRPKKETPSLMMTVTLDQTIALTLQNEARRQDRTVSSLLRMYIKRGLVQDGLLDEEQVELAPLDEEQYLEQRRRRTDATVGSASSG